MTHPDAAIPDAAEVLAYQAKELAWFLAHESWAQACAATERRITREWEAADNPLSREMAWHKLHAFRSLKSELRALAARRPTLTE